MRIHRFLKRHTMKENHMSKFTIASLKTRFTALRKHRHRPNTLKLAAIVALVVLSLWFLNYLTDGALLIVLGWIFFLLLFGFILVLISPDGAVKLVKQLIEESAAYRAKLKRSYKELRELLKKKKRMPRIVVDDEPAATSAPAPVAPVPGTTPAPVPASTSTAAKPAKTTKRRTTTPADVTKTPAAAPAPVKSSVPVTVVPDAMARVASATSRRRRTTAARTLTMPGDGTSD
jgi:hypothetical protein